MAQTFIDVIARGAGGARAELRLQSDATFLELLRAVDAGLKLKVGPDEQPLVTRLRILTGFPPRPLALAGGDSIGGHVGNKDSLKVELKPDPATAAAATAATS